MFTTAQIKSIHSKVKSGSDFPQYVQELIQLGVVKYDMFVHDGHAKYFGKQHFTLQTAPKYANLPVEEQGDSKKFKRYLKLHQQGETDYATFCRHSAETGVVKWTVDTTNMSCTYYDKLENKMVSEKIPTP